MRIRKHAARILASLSIPTQSCAAAAAGRELEMHVCELNQSPWDAMAFTPTGAVPLYHYQVRQEVEEVGEYNAFAWAATESDQASEEPAAAVTDVSGITATQSTLRRRVKIEETAEGAEEEQKRERKIEAPKKGNASHNTKKTKRKSTSSCATERTEEVKVKMEVESATTAVVTTCKKSDGKGWHCKREAQRPHSLCEYHLIQVRSYYSNFGGTAHLLQQQQQQALPKMNGGGIDAKQNAALIQDKKNIKKKKIKKRDNSSNGNRNSISSNGAASRTRRKPAPSDFYYYYSGFGPWWGKRRSGGDGVGGVDREASNVDESNGDDERDGACDGAPPWGLHDQAPDDLDDDDDETDDVDDLGEYDGVDVVAGKRMGRKPIKARSLKSLL